MGFAEEKNAFMMRSHVSLPPVAYVISAPRAEVSVVSIICILIFPCKRTSLRVTRDARS